MLGIIVVAGSKGFEARGQAINLRIVARVVVIGEDNMERLVELLGRDFARAFRD